ncbi:2-dehydropantoate 2-reductase [Saccharibacillus sp. CPCC 101409]|uniref:ketopantoate reductase family protein n=1 Tax=Saccharibacillus sp. CPCC 101409 TaxID=3058041 RepID=UPI0026716D2C|nr:2-dehydropantoate 2-reductase [Saccharibacillus sp. CPCC 101409]MDO3409196.1 2-dehydropantoate 2-reductase [Saccharibacillus sp. CPCC 101409]
MKIGVIGGGSLGLLFAAYAAKAGGEVELYTRSGRQADRLEAEGIELQTGEENSSFTVAPERFAARPIAGFARPEAQDRWILLAVKQKDLSDELIDTLRAGIRSGDRLLCLQNGVGHLERLDASLPGIPVYAALTTEGARRLSDRSVFHAGRGVTSFGMPGRRIEGEAEKNLARLFEKAGLSMSASNEIETLIYRKLAINAVVNPLTAIWNVPNGGLLASQERLSLMRGVFDEIARVYAAAGIAGADGWWEEVLGVCRATAANRSSMLEDVSAGRETEAPWISGGVCELARRFGADAPLSGMLLRLVQGMRE